LRAIAVSGIGRAEVRFVLRRNGVERSRESGFKLSGKILQILRKFSVSAGIQMTGPGPGVADDASIGFYGSGRAPRGRDKFHTVRNGQVHDIETLEGASPETTAIRGNAVAINGKANAGDGIEERASLSWGQVTAGTDIGTISSETVNGLLGGRPIHGNGLREQ